MSRVLDSHGRLEKRASVMKELLNGLAHLDEASLSTAKSDSHELLEERISVMKEFLNGKARLGGLLEGTNTIMRRILNGSALLEEVIMRVAVSRVLDSRGLLQR